MPLNGGRFVVLRASTDVTPFGSVIVSAPGSAAPVASVNGTQVYAPVAFGVLPSPTRRTKRLAGGEVVSLPALDAPTWPPT